MNPFYIRVKKLDFSLPAGGVIPAAQLQEIASIRDILSDASVRAAEIVQAADADRGLLLAQAQQQADRIIPLARNQMETEVLAQHVRWLVAADRWESSLITHARQHILTAMASVVTTWAGQQSVDQILIHRLGAKVESMAQQDNVVLRVHPQHLPAVISALGTRVQCVGDESLAEDQAQLGSPMLLLSLSLRRHLSQLVLWLQQSPPSLPHQASDT
ncbi:type III secretion system stator protein SctL [Yersinia pekkanenii]|uniref:Type III secretion apparatus protein, HrpE/YscL family n=1 Tax=Yersinia pekkanenii TaxID=1288385 RepID=A0A0T9QSD1_9GAMM|nr:type III secretion system stator protein SctL [Yersinia pekkanenii]CNI25113.1 type III secretion apparatus protein%2C HrpE/YscL family [Yersinia pekkanenii]CRY68909.1 type III secretion apparatus protein%2C HrpE/YscL family [Yersinia pekkanenii]